MNTNQYRMDQSIETKGGVGDSSSQPRRRPASALFLPWARRRWAGLLCAALLAIMALQMLAVISRKTLTVDEAIHIPAGYYYLVNGEFEINNEHPPLVKMWAALPLLLIQPEEPETIAGADENYKNRTWSFHKRFWEMNRAAFETITFWPRVMMIALTLGLGALIFFYARTLFGPVAAVLAVALFTLEPTLLAHGRVVHTDVPAALAYLLFFVALHRYWESRTMRGALLLGLVSGGALLTKFSLLVIAPVLFIGTILLGVRAAGKREAKATVLLHALLVSVIILVMVNLAYRFQHPALDSSDISWVQTKSASHFAAITSGIRVLSKAVPTYYLFGIYNVGIHNQYGHAASLWGRYSDVGWWYYFPVAFALKTTIPFLLLGITALGWGIWRLAVKHDGRFLWLIVPIGIYLTISLTSHINIGIRHFLPVFPFLFIAGGALLRKWLDARRNVGIVVLVILFGWMSFEAAHTFPDYIPYMNQLATSHPHWYYLSDSNVEWGDDVGALAAYLKARGETKVNAALSGGAIVFEQYGVDYLDMASLPPNKTTETRYVAIGASFLNGSVIPGDENVIGRRSFERMNLFARYRDRKPEAVFGNSIYLYRERE